MFYKFNTTDTRLPIPSSPLQSHSFPPTIERSLLAERDTSQTPTPVPPKINTFPPEESPSKGLTVGNDEIRIEPMEQTLKEKKYPPGEGPCRNCGLEIHGKKIFSKNDNELSGQWHRECFRCVKCDIKFNKSIPCYILDDTPYCQQHFHEENNSICKICKKFIEGKCLENDKLERFHVHCLNCAICHEQIYDDYYIFNGELPLCLNHDIDKLLKEGLTGNNLVIEPDTKNDKIAKRRTRLIDFTD